MHNPTASAFRPFRSFRSSGQRKAARGYTFIETLVATGIMAVLTSAGVPSLKSFVVNSTADSQISDFTSALRFARSQAMKRGEPVTLCARAAGSDEAEPVCRSAGADWSEGWVVFVDRGQHGQLDDGDQVLRVHQRPATAGRVGATANQRSITFLFSGISSKANTTVRFSPAGAAADDDQAAGTKVVCINKPGRARVVAGSACS